MTLLITLLMMMMMMMMMMMRTRPPFRNLVTRECPEVYETVYQLLLFLFLWIQYNVSSSNMSKHT
jgi:hypothetical protein